jgi:hypothetical protein
MPWGIFNICDLARQQCRPGTSLDSLASLYFTRSENRLPCSYVGGKDASVMTAALLVFDSDKALLFFLSPYETGCLSGGCKAVNFG